MGLGVGVETHILKAQMEGYDVRPEGMVSFQPPWPFCFEARRKGSRAWEKMPRESSLMSVKQVGEIPIVGGNDKK